VQVSGPAGYSAALSGSATLSGLVPGSYAVAAQPVSAGGTTYHPTPLDQTVGVAAGGTAVAGIAYAAQGGPSLDLTVHGAYLTQATQRYDGSVPLVAGRDAYLRVFALANEANALQPQVRVRLYHGLALVQTYTLTAPAASVPLAADESVLSRSWNVPVPGSLVVPGLQLLAEVDPAGAIPEGNESNNQFPLSGSPAAVNVQALPTFALRFVPVLQQVNGMQGNITAGNQENFLADLKKELPVGAYDADIRAPYTTSAPALQGSNANGAWGTILSEVLALRAADASTRYYYGVVKVTYGSGVAGIGYVGGGARTALGWDYLPSGSSIMAHELGHNMGRWHAPCGGPAQPDPGYPYPGGQIGVWGLDLSTLALKAPTLPDLMTYCGPSWVSDYNWSGMVTYRMSGPNNAPEAGAGAGLLIWGRIGANGIVLEPAFQVPLAGAPRPAPGPHQLELLDPGGRPLSRIGFAAPLVADLPGAERHFAFVVPLPGTGGTPAGIRVSAGSRSAVRMRGPTAAAVEISVTRPAPGQVELRWDATRHPMVLVRDAGGRILSFARNGVARVFTSAVDLDLQLSDGVGTVSRQARVLR
jgi:hypothetical protein